MKYERGRVQTDDEYKLLILLIYLSRTIEHETIKNHMHHAGLHEIQIPTESSLAISFAFAHYTENLDCEWWSTVVEIVIHCPWNKCLVWRQVFKDHHSLLSGSRSVLEWIATVTLFSVLYCSWLPDTWTNSVRNFLPSFNSSVLERTRVWRSCKDCYQILFPCFLRLSYSRTLPLWSWLARENTFCGGAGYWGDWTHHHHPWSDKDNNNDNFNKVPTMMFQGLTSNKVPIISRSVPLLVPVIYLLTYDHGPVHIIRWIAWCTRHFCNTTKQICGGNLICYFTQQFTRVSVFSLRRAPLTRGMPLGFSVLLHEPVREVLKTWALYSVFYVWDVLDWIMHLCGP